MIRTLTLKDVGPARDMRFAFSPRLNVLTGDNGLGKTFVLDVLWWVLTTTWAGEKAFPWRPLPPGDPEKLAGAREAEPDPGIAAALGVRAGEPGDPGEVMGRWSWSSQEWIRPPAEARVASPPPDAQRRDEVEVHPHSLVLYARIDGSYAVFDALYAKGGTSTFAETAIVLSPAELWDGKELADSEVLGGRRTVIGGLVADWVSWQNRAKSPEFVMLCEVLRALSPPDEPALPAEPTRVHLRDRRDIPTLATSYGVVPVTLASAGMKRALSLAYLLVWAWAEHEKAAKASRRQPTRDVVLLIDEPELHQHPAWQRAFLPAVLRAVSILAPTAAVQVFAATHSPLVLASLESAWIESLDDLFVLERDGSVVRAKERAFVREGDVTSWLASSVFGGVSGRSRAAELAIGAAQHFLAERPEEAERALRLLDAHVGELPRPSASADEDLALLLDLAREAQRHAPLVDRIHHALQSTLPGHDEFWVHWTLVHRPGRRPKEGGDAPR